jgi:hypothetical protein
MVKSPGEVKDGGDYSGNKKTFLEIKWKVLTGKAWY